MKSGNDEIYFKYIESKLSSAMDWSDVHEHALKKELVIIVLVLESIPNVDEFDSAVVLDGVTPADKALMSSYIHVMSIPLGNVIKSYTEFEKELVPMLNYYIPAFDLPGIEKLK